MSKEKVPSWMIAQALCCLRVCQIVKDEKTGEEDVLPLDSLRIQIQDGWHGNQPYFVRFQPWFDSRKMYLSIARLQTAATGMETLEDGKWAVDDRLFVLNTPKHPVVLDFSVETRNPETGLAEVRTLCTEADFREELAKHRPDDDAIQRYATLAYADQAIEQQTTL